MITTFQEFETELIVIEISDSKRPGRITIEKSNDNSTYTPWVYVVTTLGDCTNIYRTNPLNAPRSLQSVLCVSYTNPPAATYEKVMFHVPVHHIFILLTLVKSMNWV